MTVNEICKKNYKDNCHNCPIRQVCIRPVGARRAEFEKWEKELEEAAGRFINGRTGTD